MSVYQRRQGRHYHTFLCTDRGCTDLWRASRQCWKQTKTRVKNATCKRIMNQDLCSNYITFNWHGHQITCESHQFLKKWKLKYGWLSNSWILIHCTILSTIDPWKFAYRHSYIQGQEHMSVVILMIKWQGYGTTKARKFLLVTCLIRLLPWVKYQSFVICHSLDLQE